MKLTDMDMLQDYEKDARMAVIAYALIETDIIDPDLRKLISLGVTSASSSQQRFADLIMKKGDRP